MIQEIWQFIFYSDLGSAFNNIALLVFRVLLCLQMLRAHGLKKIGVGVGEAVICATAGVGVAVALSRCSCRVRASRVGSTLALGVGEGCGFSSDCDSPPLVCVWSTAPASTTVELVLTDAIA